MAFTMPRGMHTEYVMIALRMPKYRETGMRSLIMSHTGSLYLKELPMVPWSRPSKLVLYITARQA